MTFTRPITTLSFALWAILGASEAQATVTAYFSSGPTCMGQPISKFRAGGPEFKVTLCLSTTEEFLCGHSIQLEAESPASSGRFEVIAHTLGANYPDPTLEKMPAPIAITHPASTHDFGGTRDDPAPPAANQVMVTFTLRALATARNPAYELRLGKNSLVSAGKDGSCLQNAEVPISAGMKLNRQ